MRVVVKEELEGEYRDAQIAVSRAFERGRMAERRLIVAAIRLITPAAAAQAANKGTNEEVRLMCRAADILAGMIERGEHLEGG